MSDHTSKAALSRRPGSTPTELVHVTTETPSLPEGGVPATAPRSSAPPCDMTVQVPKGSAGTTIVTYALSALKRRGFLNSALYIGQRLLVGSPWTDDDEPCTLSVEDAVDRLASYGIRVEFTKVNYGHPSMGDD